MSFMPVHDEEDDQGLDISTDDQDIVPEEVAIEGVIEDDHVGVVDFDPDMAKEVDKIIVEDAPKKAHMVSQSVIDKELEAEDLYDKNSI
jgi:hypothetical protein